MRPLSDTTIIEVWNGATWIRVHMEQLDESDCVRMLYADGSPVIAKDGMTVWKLLATPNINFSTMPNTPPGVDMIAYQKSISEKGNGGV